MKVTIEFDLDKEEDCKLYDDFNKLQKQNKEDFIYSNVHTKNNESLYRLDLLEKK